MEEKTSEEREGALVAFDPPQGLSPAALEKEKNLFWWSSLLDCFYTGLAVFERADLKQTKDEWEVPFEAISELVYLGSGAQGVVYSGMLRGEMVAVKKLRNRAETNIKHLRKLNHDNIVRFRGVCSQAPCYCVVMEYCQYGPLFEFLQSGASFALAQIYKWAREIAHGMTYLHNHKIIHRDLKSPNILIADNLVVKVSDFGTSREWDDASAIMSFTGTVAWMAPEVIRHEPCCERVDVWSFGVVLWELVTQQVPYRNMETHAIMWGVGTDSISLPLPASCPAPLRLLVRQCWSRVPRNRPPFKIIAAQLELASAAAEEDEEPWRRRDQEEPEPEPEPVHLPRSSPEGEAGGVGGRGRGRASLGEAMRVYEQQVARANELYMEVCAVRLQLEQREQALRERERALTSCRCGVRRNLRQYQRMSSSSTDNVRPVRLHTLRETTQRRPRPRGSPARASAPGQPHADSDTGPNREPQMSASEIDMLLNYVRVSEGYEDVIPTRDKNNDNYSPASPDPDPANGNDNNSDDCVIVTREKENNSDNVCRRNNNSDSVTRNSGDNVTRHNGNDHCTHRHSRTQRRGDIAHV